MTIPRKRIYTSDYLTYRLNNEVMTDRERQTVIKHRRAVLRAEKHWDKKERAERLAHLQRINGTQNGVK